MAQNLKFRNPDLARSIAEKIKTVAPKKGQVKFCHVCGTHEWTITHFGLRSLLPENVESSLDPDAPYALFLQQKSMRRYS
jgi:hydrogenase expression/formation protein HypD